MKVLLTGATGHIGSNVARELVKALHHVTALVRESSDRRGIDGLPVEVVVGDVLDEASVARASKGADAVVHCAAEFAMRSSDPEPILRASIEGTRNVLRAASAAGAKRAVVTGSAAAVGASATASEIRSEKDWPESATVPYYRAKVEGERAAKAIASELGLATVVLLPTLVLGPNDHRKTPSMQPILDVANGKQPTVDGGLNVVSVVDVARAHVLALTRGDAGERYLIAGENLTLRELGEKIAAFTGKVPKHMSLPKWAVRLVATAMEAGSAISGRPPALTRALVDDAFGKFAFVDGSKARAVLGLQPVSAGEVVEETLRWFLDQGWLAPAIAENVRAALSKAKAA